jgi:hypothetical protein
VNPVLQWADTALLLLILFGVVLVLHGINWLRLVVPAWMFHMDSLMRGQDPPGDAPVPDAPPPDRESPSRNYPWGTPDD